jgi:hypothetical protein
MKVRGFLRARIGGFSPYILHHRHLGDFSTGLFKEFYEFR